MTPVLTLRRPLAAFFILLLAFALAGCKESLYSQLSEQEANEVYTALSRAGIPASKVPVDKAWGIEVAAEDIPRSVEALNRVGLPRGRFSNLGEMFKREGIVSTPNEERVRFLYGVSQELSQTLSDIDGVVAARVHIVIPQNDPLAEQVKPSSASVFIKHRADVDLQPMLSSIRSLVLRSVEGLSHDTVYVSLFPAEPPLPARGEPPYAPLLGINVPRGVATWLTPLLWILLIALPLVLGYVIYRYRQLIRADLDRVRRRRSGGLVDGQVVPAADAVRDPMQPMLYNDPPGNPQGWDGVR